MRVQPLVSDSNLDKITNIEKQVIKIARTKGYNVHAATIKGDVMNILRHFEMHKGSTVDKVV